MPEETVTLVLTRDEQALMLAATAHCMAMRLDDVIGALHTQLIFDRMLGLMTKEQRMAWMEKVSTMLAKETERNMADVADSVAKHTDRDISAMAAHGATGGD